MNELYFAPGACSFVPHVGLEIIRDATGNDFKGHIIKLHKNEQNAPEYLKINPNGQVPTLVADGKPITQILSIIGYLADTNPQAGLLPTDPQARAEVMSLLGWFNTMVHPAFTHVFMPQKFADSEAAINEIRSKGRDGYLQHLQRIDAMAPKSGFLSGDKVGFADAYAFTTLRWGGYAGIDPNSLPAYKAYVERVIAEPAVARAMATERVALDTYKG